jgi:hypothetical protein
VLRAYDAGEMDTIEVARTGRDGAMMQDVQCLPQEG